MHRPFRILKFRTMHVHNGDPALQVTTDDERIYPFGGFLRKFSLDELPQFWNVLEGEMSVIGPRPHLPQHDEQFSRALNNYHVRAVIKPGITGLAQVTGYRGATQTDSDIQGRVKADIQYLENWTLVLDLWILGKTVGQVLAPSAKAC
jgi:putative colanic acid biosysnthesis UDP-glucose lipid carrier transferase